MASAFPHQPQVDHVPRKRTGLVVHGDDSPGVLQALSSATAQGIVASLRDEPGTASDIADAVGTSLQNVRYHLDRLCDASLVEPAGTWYSAKGNEMTVYALATEELVIQFGSDD